MPKMGDRHWQQIGSSDPTRLIVLADAHLAIEEETIQASSLHSYILLYLHIFEESLNDLSR